MKLVVISVLLTVPMMAQRKPGSQLDHLPSNMQVLTYFGERADISPDHRRVAFMAQEFRAKPWSSNRRIPAIRRVHLASESFAKRSPTFD